jgi:primosomal protein N' (replication factor Y)
LDRGPDGWKVFWRKELQERKELSMPPFLSLVKIESNASDIRDITKKLESTDFEYWSPDEEGSKQPLVWIRTKKLSELRRLLEPFFHIKRVRRGYPAITVWHE